MIDPRFLPFEEAREYARSLKLSSSVKWFEFVKSPDFPHNIPKRPESTYKDEGWRGYSDWLATGNGRYVIEGRLSFEEAREYVRKLNLNGLNGWITYCKSGKRPANIPASAHTAYRDKWQGYGDWTGSGRKRHTNFLPFKEARKFARSLGIFTENSWKKFAKTDKRPANIPANPKGTYKKEWQGWKNWLRDSDDSFTEHLVDVDTDMGEHLDKAIDELESNVLPFEKAREYVRKLYLKGQKEWFAYAKSNERPTNIPASPYNVYHEWAGFPDWLGTKRIRETEFVSFEEAREYARSLKIGSQREWDKFVQSEEKPKGIPTQPDVTYAKTGEWTNWYDWLGKIRRDSGQGHAVRRIISRFQELEKMGNSLEEIMGKLSEEFPRQSEDKIREILLKWAEGQSDR